MDRHGTGQRHWHGHWFTALTTALGMVAARMDWH